LLCLANPLQAFPSWPLWLASPGARDNANDPKSWLFRPTAVPVANPFPTQTFTALGTASFTPSVTASPSASATPTQSATLSDSQTYTATPSISPTFTASGTINLSSSPTSTDSFSPTPTLSPTVTQTPSWTPTWSPSPSPSNTSTSSPSGTPSSTASPTPTPSNSPSPSPSVTPQLEGATLSYDEYEAEAASYTGTLIGPSTTMAMNGGSLATEMAAESSGREAVKLSAAGQHITFTTLHQCNSIVVRYIIPDAAGGGGINATLSCYVNGVFNQELHMTSVYNWDYGANMNYTVTGGVNQPGYNKSPAAGSAFHLYDETHALLGSEVPAGSTITLQVGASDTATYYVIDLIDLEDVPAAASMPGGFVSITSPPYNAVNDGVTDNSAAIQSCLSANTQVWIPPGNFACTSAALNVPAGTTVQGAGMWYSTLSGYYATLNLNGSNTTFSDFLLSGGTTNRDDNSPDCGFNNGGGTGSSITHVWVEHEKCGYWMNSGGNTSNGMVITGCRFRDLYADGVNLNQGSSNCTVTQCHFRNTGDDSLAEWSQASPTPVNVNNTFSYNTIQCPWRADCIAMYGGNSTNVIYNVCSDTLNQAGIIAETGFNSRAFGGTTLIQNNTLTRAGGLYGGANYGALDFWANQLNLAGAFTVDGMTISNAYFSGIHFNGPNNAGGVTVTNTQINSPGFYGIQATSGTLGTVTITTTVVTSPGVAGLQNASGGSFIIVSGTGDVGW
jgi:hypothetical protein